MRSYKKDCALDLLVFFQKTVTLVHVGVCMLDAFVKLSQVISFQNTYFISVWDNSAQIASEMQIDCEMQNKGV